MTASRFTFSKKSIHQFFYVFSVSDVFFHYQKYKDGSIILEIRCKIIINPFG